MSTDTNYNIPIRNKNKNYNNTNSTSDKVRSTEVINVPSSASHFTVTVPDINKSHETIELVIANKKCASSTTSSSTEVIEVPCDVSKVDIDLNNNNKSEDKVKVIVDLCCPSNSSSSFCPAVSSSSSSCPSSSSTSSSCNSTIDIPCDVHKVDVRLNQNKSTEVVKLNVDLCCPSNSSSSSCSSNSSSSSCSSNSSSSSCSSNSSSSSCPSNSSSSSCPSNSSSSSCNSTIDIPCDVHKVDIRLNQNKSTEVVKLAVDLCCKDDSNSTNSSSSSCLPSPSSSSSSSSSSCPTFSYPSSSCPTKSSCTCSSSTIDVPCSVHKVDIKLNEEPAAWPASPALPHRAAVSRCPRSAAQSPPPQSAKTAGNAPFCGRSRRNCGPM